MPETERTGPPPGSRPDNTTEVTIARRPKAVASLWLQLEAWRRATRAQRQAILDATSEARRTTAQRRARVLAHPDLAARLVSRLGFERPDQWNGYVPPRLGQNDELNTSPRRTVLIEIAAEALEREATVR